MKKRQKRLGPLSKQDAIALYPVDCGDYRFHGGFIAMAQRKYLACDVRIVLNKLAGSTNFLLSLGDKIHAEKFFAAHPEVCPQEWCIAETEEGVATWFEAGGFKSLDVGKWKIGWENHTRVFVICQASKNE